ncbi:hypothetical protein CEXT_353711 [Caerostris extrusa]|uniref:Uncharacterized protein n=1 Tax=Caerostris extrusa TaxID=172846 RepID=A0AAV4QV79_CAEEX|nr:hypothetical protein CEXT_353711 [Caerostris extrusa]
MKEREREKTAPRCYSGRWNIEFLDSYCSNNECGIKSSKWALDVVHTWLSKHANVDLAALGGMERLRTCFVEESG